MASCIERDTELYIYHAIHCLKEIESQSSSITKGKKSEFDLIEIMEWSELISFMWLLTAAKLFPPAVDNYSFLLTLTAIGRHCLAQHLFVSVIQAHIIHTIVHEWLGVQFCLTFLEDILGCDSPTERLCLVQLKFIVVTGGTVFLTRGPAGIVLILFRCLPALDPLFQRGDSVARWIMELITVVTVEVATQTTDTAVVAAGKLDEQRPLIIKGDDQAKVCFHHGRVTTLLHPQFFLSQLHRKILQLSVHLMGTDQSINVCQEILHFYPE